MPKFKQTAKLLEFMKKKESIRNVGIVAHIDHGKTTLTDSLLANAGLLPSQLVGSARALDYLKEEQRRGITMKTAGISLLYGTKGKTYVVNLIDTPGHVDFSGKVTRALRILDGAVVVVDSVEEIMAQTETVTLQALEERVRPLLFINKVDRLIQELKLDAKEIQSKFTRIVSDFNSLIDAHAEQMFRKKWRVDPASGTVVFGSALHRWGFRLSDAKEQGMTFKDVFDAYGKGSYVRLSKSLPVHNAILGMVARSVPSPVEAQPYRLSRIWRGKPESPLGKAISGCDADGPLAMYVTNVLIDDGDKLTATGRLFSGSVKEGDSVYLVNAKKESCVENVSISMGAFKESINQATAGNVVNIAVSNSAKAGETIVDCSFKEGAVRFEDLRYVSRPVVTIAVEPKDPKNLPALRDALKRLSIEDPNLAISMNERTGEYVISGMGELHLGTAISFLREYGSKLETTVSEPTADYRESISRIGEKVVARSPNKQNSLRVQVEPLKEETADCWATDENENALINLSGNAEPLDCVREAIVQGFLWACKTGPLCEQPLRKVKVKLLGAEIHEDASLRETQQIMRTMSRAVLGSVLAAGPMLLEPIYRIEVSTSNQWFGTCTNIITSRRGKITGTKGRGNNMTIVGFIPVAQTFGLTNELRSGTSGHAFWQSLFDHWDIVPETVATELVPRIRRRKGLAADVPNPTKFIDTT